ncbi:MAG: HXXEE domain-containing protein [Acidobacteriota bacterium]
MMIQAWAHLKQCDNRTSTFAHGLAWLCLALAAHAADEALTDFLSVYNPAAHWIREKFYLPLPIFTFEMWIGGLIAAIIALLSLSAFAFRGAKWMRTLSYVFALVMLANGLLHIAGSIYLGRWMPGVYSSPLLLAAAINLLVAVRRNVH